MWQLSLTIHLTYINYYYFETIHIIWFVNWNNLVVHLYISKLIYMYSFYICGFHILAFLNTNQIIIIWIGEDEWNSSVVASYARWLWLCMANIDSFIYDYNPWIETKWTLMDMPFPYILSRIRLNSLMQKPLITYLNPYAMYMFTMKEAHLPKHFVSFSKHMPAYVKALHVYRRSKAHSSRV